MAICLWMLFQRGSRHAELLNTQNMSELRNHPEARSSRNHEACLTHLAAKWSTRTPLA